MEYPYIQNPQLDGRSFFLEGKETGVLLLHGFTATTVEVRSLAESLHQHGLAVCAPLLPGHGTVPEDMHAVSWQDWTRTVEQAYLELAERFPRVIIGGESLGGLLTLYLGQKYSNLSGIVLYAPALKLKGIWQARFLAPFIKTIPKSHSGSDPDGHLPWQGYTVASLPALNQLRKLQNLVQKNLSAVCQPTLIFHGRLDLRIDPKCAEIIYEQVSSPKKELVILERSGHTILLDIERDFVYRKTLEFIQQV